MIRIQSKDIKIKQETYFQSKNYNLWAWITKAMLLRGDNESFLKLKNLFSSDQNEEDLKQIFEATENIICHPYSGYICKQNGFNVNKMFPQRLFSTIF